MSSLVNTATVHGEIQPAINQRGRHGPYALPKNWRAVEGNPGELLYIIRICDTFWCRIEGGEWAAYGDACGPMTGMLLGRYPTRDHALVACRDHLHANTKEDAML